MLVVATAVLASGITGNSQTNNIRTGTRVLVSVPSVGPIDRGLRAHDPPRPPGALSVHIDGMQPPVRDVVPFVAGRVVVKFKPDVDAARRAQIAAQIGGQMLARRAYADFDSIAIDRAADPEAAARSLQRFGEVQFAQASYKITASFRPNDEFYSQQWNFPAIDMEKAWDINQGATSNIIVAVLDTGVAFKNATFRYQVLVSDGAGGVEFQNVDVPFAAAPDLGSGRFVSPHDFIWEDDNPVDLDGHGTHVTGTVGQSTNNSIGVAGMAFNVRIMPIKVISGFWDQAFGAPNSGTDAILAQGIRYAVDNGAKILNLSLGFNTTQPLPVVEDALRYAVGRGAFISIAGGNEFERGNPVGVLATMASKIDGAISVASVGQDLTRAYYSSTGSFIEIAAPGGDQRKNGTTGGILQQTIDSDLAQTFPPRFDAFAYEFFQGTSQATPHVSGLAALLMQQGITSPAAIEAAIKQYARDLGPAGRDDEFGVGLISPRSTLRGLGLAK
jgi:serine protease